MKVKAFLLTAVMAMSISSASAEIECEVYHSWFWKDGLNE